MRVFWRQWAWPRWTDIPMSPHGACFLSWDILPYSAQAHGEQTCERSWYGHFHLHRALWRIQRQMTQHIDQPRQTGTYFLLIPAQTSWSRQTQLEKRIVLKCVWITFLFHCFLIDFEIKPKFLDHAPYVFFFFPFPISRTLTLSVLENTEIRFAMWSMFMSSGSGEKEWPML